MPGMSRREFLFGGRRAAAAGAENRRPAPTWTLPPEFSPALLRAEGARLGLDVDRLSEDELAAEVLAALAAPPSEPGR